MRKKLIFASNNEHKLRELRELAGDRYEIMSLNEIGCNDDIPETADTIEGNALMKAEWIRDHYGVDCFSDDTGLEIDALGGEPGVMSARYAGPEHDSNRNVEKVLRKMTDVPRENRTARFRTIIALILNGETHTFVGCVEGEILTERHGDDGFGYDPIFRPLEADVTFAEMTPDEKNAISHRGRAVRALFQ